MATTNSAFTDFRHNTLFCISFNAARLTKKYACDMLRQYCHTLRPAIICVTETWANDNNLSAAELSLDGMYNVVRKDRVMRAGGGVCILTRNDLSVSEVDTSMLDSELVAIDCHLHRSEKYRLICAYFSPSGSADNQLQRMRNLCSELDSLLVVDFPTIITGDFNLPNIQWTSGGLNCPEGSKEFIFASFCCSAGLVQLVDAPTRGTNILDLLLTDCEEAIFDLSIGEAPIKSDHLALYFRLAAA